MVPNENCNQEKKDFSIIFKKMEEYNEKNPSFAEVGVNSADLQNDQTIREFGEICRQINDTNNNPVVFQTFS